MTEKKIKQEANKYIDDYKIATNPFAVKQSYIVSGIQTQRQVLKEVNACAIELFGAQQATELMNLINERYA